MSHHRPWYFGFTLPLTATSSKRLDESPPLSQSSTTFSSPPRSLTPPPRLYLRSLQDLTPPTTPLPPQPPFPAPWLWRCHHCYNVYKLGVTRRCLEDGHFFCSLPVAISSPSSESSERTKKKKKRRAKPQPICASEFDYTGWERYNSWRGEIRALSEPAMRKDFQRCVTKGRFKCSNSNSTTKGEKWNRSCEWDCAFPSECLQEREWERRMRVLRDAVRDESLDFIPSLMPPSAEECRSPVTPPSATEVIEQETLEAEREYYRSVMKEFEDGDDEKGEEDELVEESNHIQTRSDLGINSEAEVDVGLSLGLGLDIPSSFSLTISNLDIDGLGESGADVAETIRDRRNSLEEESLGSPLKESFSFEVGGVDVVELSDDEWNEEMER